MRGRRRAGGGLAPSAKFVLRVLGELGEASFSELLEETGLPKRTLFSALRALRDRGLVEVRQDVGDARKRLYRLALKPSLPSV